MSDDDAFGARSTAEEVTRGIDLGGTTWLITGCNSGLGFETARVLALRGARIIGLARTEAKAEAALERLGIDGAAVACELSDLASVRAAVEAVRGLGALDGIIANAGISRVHPARGPRRRPRRGALGAQRGHRGVAMSGCLSPRECASASPGRL